VIGCGNLPFTKYLDVPLSTIDPSARQLGEEAARLALQLITRKHNHKEEQLLIEPKLIARESTMGREHRIS
jgi:DNA-binding LacI/PurR family transcriptional regulator